MLAPSAPPLTFPDTRGNLLPGEKKFHWSKSADLAAQWIAEGNLYYKDIAAKLNIPATRLLKWREHTEFKERIESLRAQYRDYVFHKGVARLEVRVESYLQDWDALENIRKGRANQPSGGLPKIPTEITIEGETLNLGNPPGNPIQEGGVEIGSGMFNPAGGMETGFIAKDYKGKDADQPVYFFDKALFDARLKLREQLAKELGQWDTKGKNEAPVNNITVTNVTVTAALSEHLAATRRAARAGVIVDVSPVKGLLVEGNPTPGCVSPTGATTSETGDAGG